MSEKATYELRVDWNNDGDYLDAGEDLSALLMDATIDRGFNDPITRMATVGRARITVNNDDQSLSPPLEASVLPRRPVRLRMTYGGMTSTVFEGLLESIDPSPGIYGDRRVVLSCVDDTIRLDEHHGPIAIQTDVYADDIISAAVSAVYTPSSTDYDQGINKFPFGADRWSYDTRRATGASNNAYLQNTNAAAKIRDACVSDWGYFFIAKDGTPTFRNRHATSLDTSVDLTLDNTMADMRYRKSTQPIFNIIEVTCYPRSISTAWEVLGEVNQDNAPMIEASAAETFELSFRDPSNPSLHIGGKDVIVPVANTDYEATSDEAGEGDDETSNVTVTDYNIYADSAEIELTNAAAHPVYVQKLRVRGHAVRVQEPITITKSDATSIAAYGRRRMPIDAVLMNTPQQAESLANFLLDYYKDPQDEMRGIAFYANNSATLMAAARDLELLDRVVVSEGQTGLSSVAGWIFSIRHTIDANRVHAVTLDLATAYSYGANPWTWGESTWDGGDVWVY
jgi:hypothetical protein